MSQRRKNPGPGKKKYICSCSFGKDSVATILTALEHDEPLDEICYVEVMYDIKRNISAEHPLHRDFIYETAIPYFEKQGVHTEVVRSDRDFMTMFNWRRTRGEYEGRKNGFPLVGRCSMNREGKLRAIRAYNKAIEEAGYTAVHYEGIAIDEPQRLARLDGVYEISLLARYGITEARAKKMCAEKGLLSPLYHYTKRGGCWFCPNARWSELRLVWDSHPEYLLELAELEKDPEIIVPYWDNMRRIRPSDILERFANEDAQVTFDQLGKDK